MSEFYVGEIRAFSFGFVPKYWAECAGQTLSIMQNQVLFALLGTRYGGDGVTTFQLPDLRDRGAVSGGSTYTFGETGGSATHALSVSEMPSHQHQIASGGPATTSDPTDARWANGEGAAYGDGTDAKVASTALGVGGGSQPHENMPPYFPVTYAIALTGIFPARA